MKPISIQIPGNNLEILDENGMPVVENEFPEGNAEGLKILRESLKKVQISESVLSTPAMCLSCSEQVVTLQRRRSIQPCGLSSGTV